MIAKQKGKIGLLIGAILFTACAAKPPRMQELPSTADASAELQTTEQMLTEAKTNNLDILAPKSYERAETNFNEAREALTKGKSKEKVLENIAESRGWLSEAQTRGEVTRTAAKGLANARSGAIQSNAPALFAKEFKELEDDTRDLTEDAEQGDVNKITNRADSLTQSYLNLEREAVIRNSLAEAQINIEAAKKDGAAKSSPKTLAATEAKLNSALSVITQNPRNASAIQKAAAEATEQSKFLLQVNQKTKAGNTEDLVLQTEKQRRQISGLTSEQAQTESQLSTQQAELKRKEAALNAAAELRQQLKPNEAEVFVENNAVKVRLKGVQFGSNQTTLNKKSTALLEKVDQVLGTMGASSIVIEGHTDSVGSPDANREISEKRAQAVQSYLIQKGQIASDQVRAVGLGEEGAISDNKTSRGRAENRRIDLIIEPRIE